MPTKKAGARKSGGSKTASKGRKLQAINTPVKPAVWGLRLMRNAAAQPLRPCLLRFTDEKKTVQEVRERPYDHWQFQRCYGYG